MLFREQLDEELRRRIAEFQRFASTQSNDLHNYRTWLAELELLSYPDIAARFAGAENTGAFPSEEITSANTFRVPFEAAWQNHQQARAWASDILDDRTTFAADGSQIYARTEGGQFFNLLRAPSQPLLVVGNEETLKELELRMRSKSRRRKKKKRLREP